MERTRDRPLVTGEITQKQAIVFLAGQLSLGLCVLLQLNWYSIFLGASSLGACYNHLTFKIFNHLNEVILPFRFGRSLSFDEENNRLASTNTWHDF